jgi:hypothetical protein
MAGNMRVYVETTDPSNRMQTTLVFEDASVELVPKSGNEEQLTINGKVVEHKQRRVDY